jgi:hypothetical protein
LYGRFRCEARALIKFKQKHTTLRITTLLKELFQIGNPCGPMPPAHNSECCDLGVPALRTNFVVVWIMVQFTSTGIYQRFGRICCRHLQGRTTSCYNPVNDNLNFHRRENLKYHLKYLCGAEHFGEFGDWTLEPSDCYALYCVALCTFPAQHERTKACLTRHDFPDLLSCSENWPVSV